MDKRRIRDRARDLCLLEDVRRNKSMKRHLTHKEWVKEQFGGNNYKVNYRNAMVHCSLIESLLRTQTKEETFDCSNKKLLCSNTISATEFCSFDKIRKMRNEIIHNIFSKKLDQDNIDKRVLSLMQNIKEVYKNSEFLKEKLSEYGINF